MKRKISNAYDAYWFLHNHPKLNVQLRNAVTPEEAAVQEVQGFLITRDSNGQAYRVYRHMFQRAIESNLDIFYTKTNKAGGHGTVDKDKSKNKHVECWLELGPLQYGFDNGLDGLVTVQTCHDPRLDTGGVTFDEGLIRLAKNVLKFYGDYSDKLAEAHSKRWCGKPVCGDCKEGSRIMKAMGLEKK